jgi:DNA-binding beta-propeller fold protein YncE
MRRIVVIACLASGSAAWLSACRIEPVEPPAPRDRVARGDGATAVTPVNQRLTPAGLFVDLPGLRPQAIALSPRGRFVYVSGKTSEVVLLDADSGVVADRVALPGDDWPAIESVDAADHQLNPDRDGQLSYTGFLVSRDGRNLLSSNVRGSVKVFAIGDDDRLTPLRALRLPPADAPRREAEIPTGLAQNHSGDRLFVCGNLSNRLLELEWPSGKLVRTIDVGVAPYDVVVVGSLAFVSNLGGRRPGPQDLVGPAGRGTVVRVDPVRHIASEGSVSVIDLRTGNLVREVVTGLHAGALAVSPNRRYVVCANAGSDTISVLDARDGNWIETLWARRNAADLLGASPNALCFAPDGEHLFVANGTWNAIGVLRFEPSERGDSRLLGAIPVGWYPGALAYDDARGRILAANIKGIGFGRPRKSDGTPEFNTHQYHGSVSLVPMPTLEELGKHSAIVDTNLRLPAIEAARLPPRKGRRPQPIPERIGEPSTIEHVVYVIKENRTYDQVLGDLQFGDGDPELCIFGEHITPNQHAIARQFVLLDNTYCSGILSADGHEWSTTAFATDYLEKSFAGFPRSYPDGMDEDDKDALAYAPSGFLWDHVLARGLTLRNYGEFCQPRVRWRDATRTDTIDFAACYATWLGENADVVFACEPVVPSLVPHSAAHYVGWDMNVPDQYRADVVIAELRDYQARGELPRLIIVCLPNDHTSGTAKGSPTPAACMADNDLAFGRIVEAFSHSKFWGKLAIIGIEDDPQAGWDHVSGYRTTCYVASPWAKRGEVVSAQYNTTSVLRTIEQILGIPPMNQFDASASPMRECFTDTPDFTPFKALAANVPLDEMNPGAEEIADAVLRADAIESARLDLSQVDQAPEDVFNRILWRAMKGSAIPYPEWAAGTDEDDDDGEPATRR